MLRGCPLGNLLPPPLALLSTEMCPCLDVSVRFPKQLYCTYDRISDALAFVLLCFPFCRRLLTILGTTGSQYCARFFNDLLMLNYWLWFCRMRAWVDLSLMFLTFFFSIVWNVEIGIVVSVVISLLLVVHRSSRARMTILVCFFPHPASGLY